MTNHLELLFEMQIDAWGCFDEAEACESLTLRMLGRCDVELVLLSSELGCMKKSVNFSSCNQ